MNRTNHGLKGTVRRLLTDSLLYTGWRISEEQHFDPDGKLLATAVRAPGRPELRRNYRYDANGALVDPRIRSSQNADGSRIEIEQLPSDENTTWSMERLHSVCFRTGDATSAETIYDTLGVPRQTVFRSALGEELSQLHYVCDKRGNILEARESESSLAGFRVTFRYDDADRVLEHAKYFGEQLLDRTLNTYTDRGDILWSKTGDNPPVEFEYEYDECGNWTRQLTRHALGSDEARRRIEYWHK